MGGRVKVIDITGQRFGKLVVIKYSGKSVSNKRGSRWLCKCDCGNEKILTKNNLFYNTKSCGCLITPPDDDYKKILECKLLSNIRIDEKKCWNWLGIPNTTGYAQISHRDKKRMSVHRLSYTLFKGGIPKGMDVCHSCDNKICINPDHLWVGTREQNLKDMVMKGRSRKGTNKKAAKLDDDKVKYCRFMSDFGVSKLQLAKFFNVCHTTMCMAIDGRSWRHV